MFDGTMVVRMHLRRLKRQNPDHADSIQLAIDDPEFATEIANQGLQSIGEPNVTGPLPPGILAKLLQFLITNGPAILALILAFFPVK